MVVAFFMLSFLFQIPCVFPDTAWTRRVNFEVYKGWLSVGVQPLRFLEYSISSTVMILVIALLCGQTDLWLLMAIAGCNWSCMIFGLLSEQIMRLRAEPLQLGTNFLGNVGAHLAGWVPFVIVWTIITSQFEWSLNAMEGVPGVVKVREMHREGHIDIVPDSFIISHHPCYYTGHPAGAIGALRALWNQSDAGLSESLPPARSAARAPSPRRPGHQQAPESPQVDVHAQRGCVHGAEPHGQVDARVDAAGRDY